MNDNNQSNNKRQIVTKLLIGAALVAYWISPIDLMSGTPIDDAIITILALIGARKGLPGK